MSVVQAPETTVLVRFDLCGHTTKMPEAKFTELLEQMCDGEAERLHRYQNPETGSVPGEEILPSRFCSCRLGDICDDAEMTGIYLLNVA